MDIEDVNELFNADRMSLKLNLKHNQQLDVFRKNALDMVEQDDFNFDEYMNNANIPSLINAISEFIAQNNLSLWQNVERYFVVKE